MSGIQVGPLLPEYGELSNRIAAMEDKNTPSSQPPAGYYKVVNFYVNPNTGKLVVAYDDTPT